MCGEVSFDPCRRTVKITGDGRTTCKQTRERSTRPPVHFVVPSLPARDQGRFVQSTDVNEADRTEATIVRATAAHLTRAGAFASDGLTEARESRRSDDSNDQNGFPVNRAQDVRDSSAIEAVDLAEVTFPVAGTIPPSSARNMFESKLDRSDRFHRSFSSPARTTVRATSLTERLKSRGSRHGLTITQDESAISRAFRGYRTFESRIGHHKENVSRPRSLPYKRPRNNRRRRGQTSRSLSAMNAPMTYAMEIAIRIGGTA